MKNNWWSCVHNLVTFKDGDQCNCKIAFSIESNKELEEYINSKKFYIDLGGNPVRESGKEAIQSLYNLTLVLPGTELKPVKMY